MFKKLAILAVVLVIALLGYASTKPDVFRVERSTSIQAPADKLFALINDFHEWTKWSPWENKDPALKRTYSGAPSGKGAIYEWEGNSEVGQGRMEILESTPSSKIVIKLDFIKPFEGHNTAEFTVIGKGESCDVQWAMHGPSPFFGKIIQVFMNMDKMVGKDFETGLANMKAAAEKK